MLREPRAKQTAQSNLGSFFAVWRFWRARVRMVWRFWAKVVDLKRCLCESRVDSRVEMSVSDGAVSREDEDALVGSDSWFRGFFLRLRLGFVMVVQLLLSMV